MAHSSVSPSTIPPPPPSDHPPPPDPPHYKSAKPAEDIVIPLQERSETDNHRNEAEIPREDAQISDGSSRKPGDNGRKSSGDNRRKSPSAGVASSPSKRISASQKSVAQTWPEIVKAALRTTQATSKNTFFASVNVFAVCVGFLYMLHGMQIQYNNAATPHLARRYPINTNEVEFIHGVEIMAVLSCLLIVAYFGNRFHRPIAIGAGAFLSATGLLTKTSAYYVFGSLQYDQSMVSPFLESELCPSNLRNLTVNNPCDALTSLDQPFSLPFSTVCFGQFLVGVGVSLYASLGLVHIEENAKPHRATFLIGLCLGMHGVGQFIGTYLGGGLMALPEDIYGPRYLVSEVERVGAWWLGYLVISAGLVLLTAIFTCFPTWFSEPEWLTSRKERLKKKLLETRIKRRLSGSKGGSIRRKYQKNTRKPSNARRPSARDSSKKRDDKSGESSEKDNKNSPNDKSKTKVDRKNSGAGQIPKRRSNSFVKKSPPGRRASAEGSRRPKEKSEPSRGEERTPEYDAVTPGGADNPAFEQDTVAPSEPATSSSAETTVPNPDTIYEEIDENSPANGEAINAAMNRENKSRESRQKKSSRDKNRSGKVDRSDSKTKRDDKRNGRVRSKKAISRQTSILIQKHIQKELLDIEHSKTYKRKKRYIRRREQLKDLPQHMWKVMRNIPLAATVLGAIFSSYLLFGYLTYLPSYARIVFLRDSITAQYVTAGVGYLPWALGLVSGTFVIYHRKMELQRSARVAVITSVICAAFSLILIAFDCDVPQNKALYNESNPILWECNSACDCVGVQLDPICGYDGLTYPSPCHAGCKSITPGQYVGQYDYSSCGCVEDVSQRAAYGYCVSSCATFYVYCVIVFIVFFIYGTGQVPVILIFLRTAIRDRYKSLSIGFSLWLVYALGIMLSPVVYGLFLDTQCEHWRSDCHEIDTCWSYHRNNYRFLYHGATCVFLLLAAACYTLAVYMLGRTTSTGDVNGDVERSGENVEPANGAVPPEEPTQTPPVEARPTEVVPSTGTEQVDVTVQL